MVVRATLTPSSFLLWLRQIGLRIDDRLRRGNGIFEYNNDPQCVFRMQPNLSRWETTLRDGTVVQPGDQTINIHLWNDQVPEIPRGGATLVWGRTMARAMGRSLQQLSEFLADKPEYDSAVSIWTEVALATSDQTAQLIRLMQHFGFDFVPETRAVSWKEQIHRWGENIQGLLLVLAVNPAVARIGILWRVRSVVMISRTALDQRYGRASGGSRANLRASMRA